MAVETIPVGRGVHQTSLIQLRPGGITAADVREELTEMGLGVPPRFAEAIARVGLVATDGSGASMSAG